jgi:hypothetical protein
VRLAFSNADRKGGDWKESRLIEVKAQKQSIVYLTINCLEVIPCL